MTITTDTETATATTFVVQAADLSRILHNANLATEASGALPVLNAVSLELDGETLMAIGTDRYRLHTDTAPVVVAESSRARALVARADIVTVLKLIKGASAVTVTISEATFAVRTENTTSTHSIVFGEFPRWRALMPAADVACGLDAPIGVSPQLLAGFAAVLEPTHRGNRKATTMRVRVPAAVKPFRVEIGETFVGIVMPIRLPA